MGSVWPSSQPEQSPENMAEAAASAEYHILVRVSGERDGKLSPKLGKYFQSKQSDGGECKVIWNGENIYIVSFCHKEDQQRVLKKERHHLVEKNLDLHIEAFTGPVESCESGAATPGQRRGSKESEEEARNGTSSDMTSSEMENTTRETTRGEQPGSDTFLREVFTQVSAALNTDIFSTEQRQEVVARFPSLRVKETSRGLEVTGTFQQIHQVQTFLQQLLEGKETPRQRGKHSAQVQPALYEYFRNIYPGVVKKINEQLNVNLETVHVSDVEMYVNFIPRGESNPEKALQLFTDTIQKITEDWKQVKVNLPESRAQSVEALIVRVRERWDKVLVIEAGNELILRGPERDLQKVRSSLQEDVCNSPGPQRAVQISTQGMKREIKVNAKQLEIVKKLKSRDIRGIEQNFQVRMEEKEDKGDKRNVTVLFRGSAELDLGVHASQVFLSLLQKTITGLQRKEIKVPEKSAPSLQEKLNQEGLEIIVEYSKGHLVLLGSSGHVWAAEKLMRGIKCNRTQQARPGDTVEPMDTTSGPTSSTDKTGAEGEKCPICMDKITNGIALSKCKHQFCIECVQQAMSYKPVCPVCNVTYGVIQGNQPPGTMTDSKCGFNLTGYKCGTIQIDYSIRSGTQGKDHPNPGRPFHGTHRTAYLPDNSEGREVLRLLRKAFDQKLIFTVGDSRTTAASDTVTWNDIHHKTNISGGPTNFGYPDPDYLKRVRDELKAKGIE